MNQQKEVDAFKVVKNANPCLWTNWPALSPKDLARLHTTILHRHVLAA
jgi:hypothetical protein